MEQFFLSTGDLSNFYTKRSRATQEGTETYDISKLSLLLCYNSRDHYPEGTEYFDDMFQSAVKDRFLPLQLTGKLLEEFGSDNNPLATADLVKPDFVRFIRSVEWWKQHHQDTKSVNYEHGLKGRWKASADRIIQFIKLYAQDNHDLFVSLVEELVSANKRYLGIESSEKNSLPPVTLDVVSWRDVS